MPPDMTHHTVLVPGALGEPERLRRAYYRLSTGRGRDQLVYRGTADQVTIGSHPANALVLPQVTVSRFHARLELDATGYRLVDLESTNGTHVGALRIGSAYIEHKARLRFGDVEVLFEIERDEAELDLEEGARWGAALGRSPAMRRLFDQLGRAAPTPSTVLLTGETGVGKDVLAEEVHLRSGRTGPFVIVDCGALPEGLIDSELFGHERGAFTGADSARAGAFEEAAGGTLFLDEIGELPLDVQSRLLRVLEERRVKRVGADRWHSVDVRVIAATHRDLARMCNERRFREDLYYRLSVVALRVPPLRERPEDIPLLVESFLVAAGADPTVDRRLMAELATRRWPGNVRELRNVVERGLTLGPDHEDLDPRDGGGEEPFKVAKARAVEAFERRYLEELLRRHNGVVAQAARAGQVDPAWIFRLVKRHGIALGAMRRST